MTDLWGPGGSVGSTRYSTLPYPPSPHYPGYTPATPSSAALLATPPHGHVPDLNIAVGLKSVDQLSLSVHISRFGTITEGYNLLITGRINNHFVISGNE